MSLKKIAGGTLIVGMAIAALAASVRAQSPAARARVEPDDNAVAALVSEVRALRADLAAAARNQLRAQLLLGRVQMQEQRLAYIDKQRTDASAAAMAQAMMTSALRTGMPANAGEGCSKMPSPDARRDCEANFAQRRQEFANQEAREQQLRAQENELANALSAEQARWSQFNTQLDELERSLR